MTLSIPSSLHLNVLQVAVDSEIEFLTDALADASHAEDVEEYSTRLERQQYLKMLFFTSPNMRELCLHKDDWSVKAIITAVEKLKMDQEELLSDEGEDDSPEMDFRRHVEERIAIAEGILSQLTTP